MDPIRINNKIRIMGKVYKQKYFASCKKYYIYIIIHPKFKGWIKVGRTMNLESRLNGYQVGCPFRDYKLIYYKFIQDKDVLLKIENHFKLNLQSNGFEWFKCSVKQGIKIIESIN